MRIFFTGEKKTAPNYQPVQAENKLIFQHFKIMS